jgi:hypothetical protein
MQQVLELLEFDPVEVRGDQLTQAPHQGSQTDFSRDIFW